MARIVGEKKCIRSFHVVTSWETSTWRNWKKMGR